MVKHVIVWSFKDGLTDQEKADAKIKMKTELEALQGEIDGLLEIKLNINPLKSSSGDFMLDSTFVSEDALKGYQVHPKHVAAATFVRSVAGERKCFDYEI